LLGYQII